MFISPEDFFLGEIMLNWFLGGEQSSWLVVFADYYNINIHSMTNFKLPCEVTGYRIGKRWVESTLLNQYTPVLAHH